MEKNVEKAFDKIQHLFTFLKLSKNIQKRMYFNIIKVIYDQPTAIILNAEKLKPFLLRSQIIQRCPCLPLLINIVLEILAKTGKKKK